MARFRSLKMTLGVSSIFLGAVVAVGCGSNSGSEFDKGGSDGELVDESGGTFGNGDGTGTSETNGGEIPGADNVSNVDPNAACATSSAGAVLPPISLVFMIDRSGSMSKENSKSTVDVRWNPVKGGLTTFFGDAKSANISASLAFFPVGDGDDPSCKSSDYQKTVVPMTQLPNAGAFSTAFNKGPEGYTPTEPALQGAIDAAKAVQKAGKNVAVVLATDGKPKGCSSDADGVDAIAAAGNKAGIKTYVIGVGPSTGNLNGFAENGGTKKAIMIPTNNAAQVSADLIKALGQIASSLLGCTYGLPAPPAGQTLDVNSVNVNYTAPSGTLTTLGYSADCSNANGWHYDSTTNPTQVILCGGSCDIAQGTSGAKLDIVFGCATAVPPGETDPGGVVR